MSKIPSSFRRNTAAFLSSAPTANDIESSSFEIQNGNESKPSSSSAASSVSRLSSFFTKKTKLMEPFLELERRKNQIEIKKRDKRDVSAKRMKFHVRVPNRFFIWFGVVFVFLPMIWFVIILKGHLNQREKIMLAKNVKKEVLDKIVADDDATETSKNSNNLNLEIPFQNSIESSPSQNSDVTPLVRVGASAKSEPVSYHTLTPVDNQATAEVSHTAETSEETQNIINDETTASSKQEPLRTRDEFPSERITIHPVEDNTGFELKAEYIPKNLEES